METTLSVKDFVIDIPAMQNQTKTSKSTTSNREHRFEVVLENNIDFVLNRKTVTTDRSLVFLISQGTFYIKNNKNESVEMLTEQKLRSFFQQIYYDKLDMFSKCEWTKNKTPDSLIDLMINIIENEDMQLMYKHGICVRKYEYQSWIKAFKANVKLFRYCYEKVNNSMSNKDCFDRILNIATDIYESIDFNNAKFFIDKFTEGNIKMQLYSYSNRSGKEFINILKKYNLNFNRFTEYISEDLYAQGIDIFNSDIFNLYKDYLNMQVSMYGKTRDKYPKCLKTEHDIMTLKFNTYMKYKQDLMVFNVAEEHRELAYEYKEYSIILPENSFDIVSEGVNLSHCVADYINRIAKNETLIVFMRRTEEIDKSLITIEVRYNEVVQVRGFVNRAPSTDEVRFLRKWAKEKDLIYKL